MTARDSTRLNHTVDMARVINLQETSVDDRLEDHCSRLCSIEYNHKVAVDEIKDQFAATRVLARDSAETTEHVWVYVTGNINEQGSRITEQAARIASLESKIAEIQEQEYWDGSRHSTDEAFTLQVLDDVRALKVECTVAMEELVDN
jgi:hypothetical protein